MPVGVKVIFTVFIVLFGIGILLVKSNANNAGSIMLWRGGKSDLMRTAMFREDGSYRRFTKLGILTYFLLFLGLIWLAIPTN